MVEWKNLGEVCKIIRGKRVTKGELCENGEYPVISGGVTPMGFINSFNREPNTITVSQYGTAGYVDFQKQRFWANDICYSVYPSEKLDNKYLWYVLKNMQVFLYSIRNTDAIPYSLPIDSLNKVTIPIPILSEQQRIVGILDTFTSSIENMKEQIALRRKQYDYYRDQLLDLEGKEEKDIQTWGDFCEMIKGNGVQKVDFVDEGVGCIHYGQIYTHYGPYTYETNKFVSKEVFEKARKASNGDIIMTDTSENVEDICKSVAYLGDNDIAVSNHALIIKHQQNPKFLSYSTQTNSFLVQKRKYVVGAKVSGIKPDHLAQIKIYLPSLSEQQRIVSILDTFEASVTNLEQQLALREKQYEYYRNKLLTFD